VAFQVSGFVSGLDVPTIVSQLMTSESYPQTMLKKQLSTVQADAAAYRDINSKFSALLSAAQALGASSFGSNLTATSNTSTVTASATAGATTGSSVTFSVVSLASAQKSVSTGRFTATDPVSQQGLSLPLTIVDASGKQVGQPLDPGATATVADVAAAINNGGYGVSASVVAAGKDATGTDTFRLQLTSQKSGTAGAFGIRDSSGTAAPFTTQAAADAKVQLDNGDTVTSSTNTFGALMNGVAVTVSATTASGAGPTTVTVGTDSTAITNKMQALVAAANATLADIDRQTDTSTGTTAALAGDYGMQNLGQQVLKAVSDAIGTNSAASVGLQLTRDGTITFDAAKFSSTLTASPTLARQLVAGTTDAPGVATRLATLAKSATDSVTGTLTSLAKGEDAQAKNLQSQIDAWTVRLAARQDSLTTQYTNLQSMLSTLQSQQSWLSSMFASSSSSSSSSSSKSS
jgi:flagellar hook-associated protein 2